MSLSPEAIERAGAVLKSELADCEDVSVRQQARHLGALVVQEVTPLIIAAERLRIYVGIERLRREDWSGNGYMWPDHLFALLDGAS